MDDSPACAWAALKVLTPWAAHSVELICLPRPAWQLLESTSTPDDPAIRPAKDQRAKAESLRRLGHLT